ncbi:uncharacterized protein LOC117654317 [Thrips palmi]|uniref:Uncharacterized protein LOC117654317 n=1 Tax=Thrips palmi TaxID=161013 RepID=A0A6P9AEQ0_THRPL|nr:uncharacterized protein LOC117654317 [Thrips palmi]
MVDYLPNNVIQVSYQVRWEYNLTVQGSLRYRKKPFFQGPVKLQINQVNLKFRWHIANVDREWVRKDGDGAFSTLLKGHTLNEGIVEFLRRFYNAFIFFVLRSDSS